MKPALGTLLFASLLATLGFPMAAAGAGPQAQAPPSPREVLFRQLTEKAMNPKELAKQAEDAHGCRLDERRIDDPKYREQDYRSSSRGNFGSMAAETNPIPKPLRLPQFFPVASRKGIDGFSIITDQSKTIPIGDFKGKVVVLFLFRPDCRWTLDMLNEIIRLQGQEEKAGIKVLAVALGEGGWPEVSDFKLKNHNALPTVFQIVRPALDDAAIVKLLPNFLVAPTTYILDRQGLVAWQILGGVRGALQDKVNHIRLEP